MLYQSVSSSGVLLCLPTVASIVWPTFSGDAVSAYNDGQACPPVRDTGTPRRTALTREIKLHFGSAMGSSKVGKSKVRSVASDILCKEKQIALDGSTQLELFRSSC